MSLSLLVIVTLLGLTQAYTPSPDDVSNFMHAYNSLSDDTTPLLNLLSSDIHYCFSGECYDTKEDVRPLLESFAPLLQSSGGHRIEISKWESGDGYLYIKKAEATFVSANGRCQTTTGYNAIIYYDESGKIEEIREIVGKAYFEWRNCLFT